ncbi:glycosyltransferase family 2 protein [Sinorhizobium numidicum]|uniref:Glycosyltransferase family 2 protein n=1 Tax=Sinorhizobium numidicum TaxID=680248 RepID=A0ABY8CU59_9HYPH|nr:glycosyltransferase family A protein [Sinorhizobium numidicum]WEX75008.1 glycosyltransferase family 2 protein [Sinorhizobium numidicum]WEX81002.1 glycosyltransferase family 2 protein [Sinorhizobium numidicum]
MSASPQLSVVIPHLNELDNLHRCLAALDAQRAEGIPFEIIVVDNGSTVDPEPVCSRFEGVRLEREPVAGPGPARNRGAGVAQAELLAFIDADCVVQPGWLRAIINLMDKRPEIDLLAGDIGILMTDPARPSAIEAYESIYSYRARLYVERHGFAATGNMAVRTRVFRSVGPFGGISTMEDTEWGRGATAKGHRLVYLAEAQVLTPSCKTFGELARRWDRHVAHEYCKVGADPLARLRWLVVSAMICISPLAESLAVLRTDRVSGYRSRSLALICLTRVRFYRARRMLGLALHWNSAALLATWNRKS